jgi:hypothetical protein
MVGPSRNCLVNAKIRKYKWRGGDTLDGTHCQEEKLVCGKEHKGQVTGQCKGLLGACNISCKAQEMQEA